MQVSMPGTGRRGRSPRYATALRWIALWAAGLAGYAVAVTMTPRW